MAIVGAGTGLGVLLVLLLVLDDGPLVPCVDATRSSGLHVKSEGSGGGGATGEGGAGVWGVTIVNDESAQVLESVSSIMWRNCSDDGGGTTAGGALDGLGAGAGETKGVNMSDSSGVTAPDPVTAAAAATAAAAFRRAAACEDSAWGVGGASVGLGASLGLGGARCVASIGPPLPNLGLECAAARGSVSCEALGRCPAVDGRC